MVMRFSCEQEKIPPVKSKMKSRVRHSDPAIIKKIDHQRSPESSSASWYVLPSTGEESSHSSSSDLP
ncbi:hypothetical protein DAPPUDRAFT_309401 [Daphnia pulex]|uniref:Uncharacterized protein n=1 Tax=Daphnia pulex TaxID=6669 RepID=E9HCJ3_DAPPU|nr:hypothetical protein DAPPUDRAFT_309401 [Daphnia pulex]|eukprot:EFX70481.1 hypothetical protein DAPPUDRAFT_309401 [Daphnia pulex]